MIAIPKGTKDVLPQDSHKWHYIENIIRQVTQEVGIREIRTPVFEHTELFLRGVGETTDIVNKEMYTFLDKGNRSMTLKPEGTAGVARAFIENGLANLPQPVKMYYVTPVFRYERPQSGRLREHHQFGVELYGTNSPYSDVEVILTANKVFQKIGIGNLELRINSIGCPKCRAGYNSALKEYLSAHIDGMCAVCKDRLEKNPLRILDCKDEKCKAICKDAPTIPQFLCEECSDHNNKVQEILTAVGMDFTFDPNIVRGLDYYTRTVFEFVSKSIGAQGTVCGGGRYNNLVEVVGGKPTPAVGFGMGIERLIMVAEATGVSLGTTAVPTIYIAPLGSGQYIKAYALVQELRQNGISADMDFMDKSLKAQMKYADKMGYKYVVVLGESEVESGKVMLKNMIEGGAKEVAIKELYKILGE